MGTSCLTLTGPAGNNKKFYGAMGNCSSGGSKWEEDLEAVRAGSGHRVLSGRADWEFAYAMPVLVMELSRG